MRFINILLAGIFWISGCAFFSDPEYPGLPPSKPQFLGDTRGYYDVSGRILFKSPEGKHSGEMLLQISTNSELKLSIFTPLAGSLIYELRANYEKFLILNYQDNNYALEDNNWEVRQSWLGMDLSLTELKWLITGSLPEKTPLWQRKKLSAGELKLLQGSTEIRIILNSDGYIESMSKSRDELLEYSAKIPLYQNIENFYFPRKIQIEDYTGNNRWMMSISEINAVFGSIKNLDFIPPEEMNAL